MSVAPVSPQIRTVAGPAISVRGNDIDTDRIFPGRFLKILSFEGIGDCAFADDRLQAREAGRCHPFDDPRFAEARLLLVNKNFGCGSSREHAPQALMRWNRGIRAVVGESFSNIFFSNCIANGIPAVTVDEAAIEALMRQNEGAPAAVIGVDLERMMVRVAGGGAHRCLLPEGSRQQLLSGRWDAAAELVAARDQIVATAQRIPYFGHWGQ